MGKPGSFPTDSNSGKAQLARDRKKDVCAARGQGNQLVLGRLAGGTCREVASALGPLVSSGQQYRFFKVLHLIQFVQLSMRWVRWALVEKALRKSVWNKYPPHHFPSLSLTQGARQAYRSHLDVQLLFPFN